MVRNYKRKSDRRNLNDGQIQLAIDYVLQGKSCKAASQLFDIPRTTLRTKIKLTTITKNENLEKIRNSKVSGFNCTFTTEQEEALARYIKEMEVSLMGLTSTDVRRLAFKFAEKLDIQHRFNHEKGLAGEDWLTGFLKRHDLSHRKAEHTSAARARGFNQEAVNNFFKLLRSLLQQYKFKAENIYNVDETGVSIVPKTTPEIIATKGRKQVGGMTAAERGETVTAEICMSAAGAFMPLLLIFPRVRENPELVKDAPAGAWAEFHKSGYMQSEIFVRWFKKFIGFTHPTQNEPVLLLLDGHVTHVKNLEVIELARENNVIILSFPPHCTHRMQPLDVGSMGPLNKSFGQEVVSFQRAGHRMTLKDLYSVFGKAFIKTAKMKTAVNSFKKCGIFPFDPTVFSATDFANLQEGDISSNSSDSFDLESKLRISKFSKTIKEMQNNSTVSIQNSQSQMPTQITSEMKNNMGDVTIPYSSVKQTVQNCLKPLVDEYFKPLVDQQAVTNSILRELVPTNSMLLKEIPINQQQPVKKGPKRGKASIITSDEYTQELIAEKLKNMKREGAAGRSKPTVISDIHLSEPIHIPKTRQPKRKLTESTSNSKKNFRSEN